MDELAQIQNALDVAKENAIAAANAFEVANAAAEAANAALVKADSVAEAANVDVQVLAGRYVIAFAKVHGLDVSIK